MESTGEKQGPLPTKVVERVNMKSMYVKVLSKCPAHSRLPMNTRTYAVIIYYAPATFRFIQKL